MTADTRLIPYPMERVLEDAAYRQGLTPTRLFAILLPVWRVEVTADITEGEPYALIDRYLERGIAEGGLATVDELAAFFALDRVLVDRALRFLAATGHVTTRDDRLALTELGYRSLHDNVRYARTLQDRRRMYFEAFACTPLTRAYYDPGAAVFLSATDLDSATTANGGPAFSPLFSTRGFRREVLRELADNPERDRYNLPDRVDNPDIIGAPELVYLPMYVVRATQPTQPTQPTHTGHTGHRNLAYTRVADTADPELSDLCTDNPELSGVFESEQRSTDLDVDRVRKWLVSRDLGEHDPVWSPDGTWRVTLPGACFGADGTLSINKVGSYIVLGAGFFHVWCTDQAVRRRALLERVDNYLTARTRIDRDELGRRVARIARQLDLGDVDLAALRRLAADEGRTGLADQLDRLN